MGSYSVELGSGVRYWRENSDWLIKESGKKTAESKRQREELRLLIAKG